MRLILVTIAAWRCKSMRERASAIRARGSRTLCETELRAREYDRVSKIWQGRMMRWGV